MFETKIHPLTKITMVIMLWMSCFSSLSHADIAPSQYKSPALKKVGVDEKLSDKLDFDLTFFNEEGSEVKLGSIFHDDKPVFFMLNYYSCNTLCSAQLNGILKGLKDLDWKPGKEFRILTVSIDPDEDSKLAKEKKASYIEALENPSAEWHFWVGKEKNIKALADAVGFRYAYDPVAKQYAHPAVTFFISGDGTISRYLYGLTYTARDIKFSLIETTQGRVGSPVEKILMSCFSYDTTLGKYTPTAFGIMRLAGVVSLFFISIFSIVMWRREFFRKDRLN